MNVRAYIKYLLMAFALVQMMFLSTGCANTNNANAEQKAGVSQSQSAATATNNNAGDSAKVERKNEEMNIYVTIGKKVLTAKLVDNSSSRALMEQLSKGDVKVSMHDYGNFEKVGPLGFSLPRNDSQYTTKAGDIILYQGNQIVFYYDTNSWDFTKLGEFQNVTAKELRDLFGEGNVTAIISLKNK